ncbi:putative sodium-coupled neutral amino acid transporter 7 isoform X1 [Venturia canescens]|uniref:putative sodium-coupled neutral amino acid transporter 7 isoform X1 n=1 Tax=Venturia canescens TaxID=32260 RepID=UPI001C9C5BC7|nr:putative sodium-coupled neutral amino acid transporter 7 isoform X1 [Venturia canescens]
MNSPTEDGADVLFDGDGNDISGNNQEFESPDVLIRSASRNNSQQRRGTTMIGTIFLIINATLGAGLLNFPQAFDKAGGIAAASMVQLIFLVFVAGTLVILAYCSDVTNTSNMQDTLAGLCGKRALIICGLCVSLYSFGCCLTFLIIVGDQFDRVLTTYYGMQYCHIWYLSRNFITFVSSCIFILPLCFLKKLEVLSYASSIGCLTIVYLIFIVIRENVIDENDDDEPKLIQTWPDNVAQGMQIVPIICFAYQSHMTAIPTYACMKERKLRNFTICSVLSTSICFISYTLVGAFGYTSFGMGQVPEDILQGYTDDGSAVTAAILAVAIKNFVTYPVVLFCGRDALLGLLNMTGIRDAGLRMPITYLWFGSSLLIAILVPDIGPVINLMGTLSAAFIFVFPGICLFQSILVKNPILFSNKDRLLLFLAILVTALGTFLCGFIFVQTVQAIAVANKHLESPLVTFIGSNIRKSLCL